MGDTERLIKQDDWFEEIRRVRETIDRMMERERVRIERDKAANRPARILLVDDDETDVFLLRRELDKFNTEVSVCHDSVEANKLIEGENYDFVFLDQKMPKVSGIEILRKLTSAVQAQFFIVTGFPDPTLAGEAFKLRCAAFVPKPNSAEEWASFRKLLGTFLRPKPS